MIARRTVVKSLAGVPLAAILADPKLAALAAEELEQVSTTTADGRTVNAVLATPETITDDKAPGVLLIHEWWGLNDQIKSMAREFAQQGFVALAVDLYGGEVAQDREKARSLMQSVKEDQAVATMQAWTEWLRNHEATTEQIGVVGWCFGGGWALRTAVHAPVDAAVVYYGNVDVPTEQLEQIEGPVLGHFATQDNFINEEMVGTFKSRMEEAGQPLEIYWYEADHAFANPTGARYDAGAAAQSWTRTLAFLMENLRQAREEGRASQTEPVQTETKAAE
ncbi:dienelactone hydrolase family protein [Caenispirillum salinarum AK4]|uniref:Dienelactone hydrolase family protein n=1 Tax=Caenispirillum salinarum AK4 TaxID=1238182 RepID=K9GT77_9PROT|nr:dienelactone hydrolase family protein [Caenispirillum salinarum]EKV29155.1 dienelactone hydrolase family protein [Caenispirillum salinarum AK4]